MKAKIALLIHVALGILFIVAIWPAMNGSNDGYTGAEAVSQKVMAEEVDVATAAVVEDAKDAVSDAVEAVKDVETDVATAVVVEDAKDAVSDAVDATKLVESDVAPATVVEEIQNAAIDAAGSVENDDKSALYSVVDGNKLDAESYAGFKLYRNWCARCHGTYGQGMVGPNLADSLKVISEKEFFHTVEHGKSGTIGSMPAWKKNVKVMAGRDQLYAYLMARSDGAIGIEKPKKQ